MEAKHESGHEGKERDEKSEFEGAGGGAGAKDDFDAGAGCKPESAAAGSSSSSSSSSSPARIRVLRIEVDEGPSPLTAPLELDVEFSTDAPLAAAHWEVKYLVDSVYARHVIRLGATEPADYGRGEHAFSFEVGAIDIAGIEPSVLTNAGLLIATLCSAVGGEVMDLNMVVQVQQAGDEFTRLIYNPLEGGDYA
jgi:hypothetical protein